MAKVARIRPTSCPCCDTVFDRIEPIDGPLELGTVSISLTGCDCCGHLMMVERNVILLGLAPVAVAAIALFT